MDLTNSIVQLSTSMSNIKTSNELSICVMKKALDQMETQGAATVQMLESSNLLDTYA